MSERLSDKEVAWWANATRKPNCQLAREVQEYRQRDASEPFSHLLAVTQTIDALCDRHGITVEGIVALVDEVFTDVPYDEDSFVSQRGLYSANYLRRLARGEEA